MRKLARAVMATGAAISVVLTASAFSASRAAAARGPGASSSHWVGLDGLGSSSVDQIGVAVSCAGTNPRYYGWYEMYPKGVQVVFRVHPGNAIQANVRYQPSRRKFLLRLTTGRPASPRWPWARPGGTAGCAAHGGAPTGSSA